MPIYKDCPVDVYRLGERIEGEDVRFEEIYQLGDSGAVLVRLDGFLAWCILNN